MMVCYSRLLQFLSKRVNVASFLSLSISRQCATKTFKLLTKPLGNVLPKAFCSKLSKNFTKIGVARIAPATEPRPPIVKWIILPMPVNKFVSFKTKIKIPPFTLNQSTKDHDRNHVEWRLCFIMCWSCLGFESRAQHLCSFCCWVVKKTKRGRGRPKFINNFRVESGLKGR